MAKFLHIHVGDRVAKTVVLSRRATDSFEESKHNRAANGEFSTGTLSAEEATRAHKALSAPSDVPEGRGHFNLPGKPEVSLTDLGMKANVGGKIYGYSDKDLKKFRKVTIPIHELFRGQATVHREHMAGVIERMKKQDPSDGVTTNRWTTEPDVSKWKSELPTVVRENGKLVVQDGHHRLAAQLLAGRTHATVALIDRKDDEYFAPPEHNGKAPNLRTHDSDDFDAREAWIEALLAKLEELHDADNGLTHDDTGGSQVGHPFYGNQYTDVAGGPKPTEAKTKSSVKAALHELLTSGHAFTLEELMAATGSKSKSNLTTAITHLKGANPHPLGVLNVLKNAKGEYHLDQNQPPGLDPYIAKPKAAKPAEPTALGSTNAPAATAPTPAPAPSAGGPVAKAPAKLPTTEENDAQYGATMVAANNKVASFLTPEYVQAANANGSPLPVKQLAKEWKESKALAMAQWKANHTGISQTPLPQEVFKEDIDLMHELGKSGGDPQKTAMAIMAWKNATQKAKSTAANAAQTKAAEAASEALKAAKPTTSGGTPLTTPTGPGAFKASAKIVPENHKHISEEDFTSGAYQKKVTEVHDALHKASSDAINNKKQVQHALDERLKGSHHFQAMQDQHVKKGLSYYKSLSATLIGQWASSSGDHNPVSVSAQLAVRDAFGMHPDSVETKAFGVLNGNNDDQVHKNAASQLGIDVSTPEKLASYKEGMKDFALAQYHETQEQFKKLGITELHLVRGMRVGSSGTGARKVNVKLQPASSFTTDHHIAKSFAGDHSIFAVKVPASQVLSSFLTGYGCTNESEVVVLHHDSLEAVQVGTVHAQTQGAMVSHVAASGQLGAKAKSSAAPKASTAKLTVTALPMKPHSAHNAHAISAVQALKDGDVEAYIGAIDAFKAQKQKEGKNLPSSTAWLKAAHQVAMEHPTFISAYHAKQGFKNIYL